MCRMRLRAAWSPVGTSSRVGNTEGTIQRRQSYKFVSNGARAEVVRRECGGGAV